MFINRGVFLSAFLFVVIAGAANCHSQDLIPKDDPILGRWKVTEAKAEGKNLDALVGYTYTFRRAGTYSTQSPKGDIIDGTFTLEQTGEGEDVRNIKLETEEDQLDIGVGGPRLGIFKTTTDARMKTKLTLCVNQIGEGSNLPRPTGFQIKSPMRLLLVLTEVN